MNENMENYRNYLKRANDNLSELSKYSRNLNLLALEEKLNPTYNRDEEIERLQKILLRRTKPNPLLIGVAGCGKTAIVEGLAKVYVEKALETENHNMPVIYELSLNSLISGARYRGDFEERLQKILNIIKRIKNVIIFIDEIHSLNAIGCSDGATSTGQILKPALARGDIKCIGATTTEEYYRHIANDKALARRFSVIEVKELTGTAKENCIENIIKEYGKYFNINTSKVSTKYISNIVDNFLANTTFPDNVIDIIDETLATATYNNLTEIDNKNIANTVFNKYGVLVV